jgi:hypothetical protein
VTVAVEAKIPNNRIFASDFEDILTDSLNEKVELAAFQLTAKGAVFDITAEQAKKLEQSVS